LELSSSAVRSFTFLSNSSLVMRSKSSIRLRAFATAATRMEKKQSTANPRGSKRGGRMRDPPEAVTVSSGIQRQLTTIPAVAPAHHAAAATARRYDKLMIG